MAKKEDVWDKDIDRETWTDKDGGFVANPLWQSGNVATNMDGANNISEVAPVFKLAKQQAEANPITADDNLDSNGEVVDTPEEVKESKETQTEKDGVERNADGSESSVPTAAEGNESNAAKGTNTSVKEATAVQAQNDKKDDLK